MGKVTAHDTSCGRVSIEPWPDRTLHPVLAEQALAEGYDFYFEPDGNAEEIDELEEPPSDYSRAGLLDTDTSSLQDVRLVAAAVASPNGALANGHISVSHDVASEPSARPAGNGNAAPTKDSAVVSLQASGDANEDSHRRSDNGLLPPFSTAEQRALPHVKSDARRGLGPPRPGASASLPSGAPPAKGGLHSTAH